MKIISVPFLALILSVNTFALNQKPYGEIINCPAKSQGYIFAAAYYIPPHWWQQQPPEVSCDYGLKQDGSYSEYLTYSPYTADRIATSLWEPQPGIIGLQCITSNPFLCPFILYTSDSKT